MGIIMVCKHCGKSVDVGFLIIRLPSAVKGLKKEIYTKMPERCPECEKDGWALKETELSGPWSNLRVEKSDLNKKWLEELGLLGLDKTRARAERGEPIVKSLNYITHINNLKSISDRGILSRNKIKDLKLEFTDISWKKVQRLRKGIRGLPKELHDYVPLYFVEDTPMLYKVREEKGEENIVIIKVNINLLLRDDVYFSDKNCAIQQEDVNIYKDIQDLKKLDWDIIMTEKCYSPKYKMFKMAEVLVPDEVSLSSIEKIVIPADQKDKLLRRMLAGADIDMLKKKFHIKKDKTLFRKLLVIRYGSLGSKIEFRR